MNIILGEKSAKSDLVNKQVWYEKCMPVLFGWQEMERKETWNLSAPMSN